MIKATELRLGNLVNFKNRKDIKYCIIEEISRSGSCYISRYFYHSEKEVDCDSQIELLDDLTPILLTEDILLKFGHFGKWDDGTITDGGCDYSFIMDGYIFCRFNEVDGKQYAITRDVKHVHQLQNLYFALTGQELTITHNPQ